MFFKAFFPFFFSNPFDRALKKLARKRLFRPKKILLAWNRGLGDIALGLYAMIHRIREYMPDAEIVFLIRKNLQDGFSLIPNIQTIIAPSWKRGESYDVLTTLKNLEIDARQFDWIFDWPNPTSWVRWQLGTLVPKLEWKDEYDALAQDFDLPQNFTYIAVQISAETSYGLWRNWPLERWQELLGLLPSSMKMILFGFAKTPEWDDPRVVDLRGKTSLFQMMSIIKNKCRYLIVPDSGILSMMYYLNRPFPLEVLSLWADPGHGILKQNVRSPNPLLVHRPLIAPLRDLSILSAKQVYEALCPLDRPFKPFKNALRWDGSKPKQMEGKVGCIILAGGQGTRLGFSSPKGMFPILGKTLFERILQKIPDFVPVAIMTSPANYEETLAYFEKENRFGKQLFFFQQSALPLLDENKRPLGIEASDGNGSLYRCFVEQKVLDTWEKLGISTAVVVPVDNPLADPLHPGLLSLHEKSGAEVTIRCIERNSLDEAMGVLIERNPGEIEVLEYCDIDPKKLREIEPDGSLSYLYAYTNLIALDFSFIKKVSSLDLPLHWVQKNVLYQNNQKLLWKGEKFLFDAFTFARSIAVLCSSRQECYAPLKTKEGPQGIEAVKRAICQRENGQFVI